MTTNRDTKPVSFGGSKKDQELKEYAEKQGKFSVYVKRLIEEDKKKNDITINSNLKNAIKQIVLELIGDRNIEPSKLESVQETKDKDKVKKSINSIIRMK